MQVKACTDQLLTIDVMCTLPRIICQAAGNYGETPPIPRLVPMLRKDCGLDSGVTKQVHNLAHAALLVGRDVSAR